MAPLLRQFDLPEPRKERIGPLRASPWRELDQLFEKVRFSGAAVLLCKGAKAEWSGASPDIVSSSHRALPGARLQPEGLTGSRRAYLRDLGDDGRGRRVPAGVAYMSDTGQRRPRDANRPRDPSITQRPLNGSGDSA